MNWDERFEKTFFTPEEIKESDRRVAAIQKDIDRAKVMNALKCRFENHCGTNCKGCDYAIPVDSRFACDYVALCKDAFKLLEQDERMEDDLK